MSEIGEILKEARIEKGYTLDDLQQITKIQKRYLQAIEDGDINILPGRFYERAFIKQYADIVGLDGEALLLDSSNQTSKEASEEFAESVNVAPTRSTQGKQTGFLNVLTDNLPTILIFLLVAAIFIIIYIAFRQTDNPDGNALINEENTEQVAPPAADETNEDAETDPEQTAEEPAEEPEEEPVADEPEEQTVSMANSTGAATTYEIAGPHPEEQTLELTADGGDSWVSITVDGTTVEAGLISSGGSLETTFGADTSAVVIVVGNAAVTEVNLNGTALEYAPESAGIVRQDLTLEFAESVDE